MKRKIGFAVLIFLFCLELLWPLEIKNGRIKLVLHEGQGRFSLYVLSRVNKQEYIPLFVTQDPRTSGISLVVENKIIKLGDSSDFIESLEKTENGARFVWTSKKIKVVQDFSFLSSQTSAETDGIIITISLTNESDHDFLAGLRLFIDTYLGEDGFPHFKTDQHQEVNRELTITKDSTVQYWVSPSSEKAEEIGLQCMIKGSGITVPDKIVFANWKRLNDTTWSYETVSTRNFNLLPYSINDSAVCHYYEPEILKYNAIRKIVTVLGNFSTMGYKTGSVTEKPTESLLNEDVSDISLSIQADIKVLNNLLNEIDNKLSSGDKITDEDISKLQDIFAGLKSRSLQYSGTKTDQ